MFKVRNTCFTINSGTGSICVWIVMGLCMASLAHFSCPPLPLEVLIFRSPCCFKNRLNSRTVMLDSLCVDISRHIGECLFFLEKL